MAIKNKHWFWNILIALTLIVCIFAFTAHYKNWTYIQPHKISILSGIYYHEIKYANLDKVEWVNKIPAMQRINGFSAFEKGKGMYQEFKDSLSDKKVSVFIDNFSSRKIQLVCKDSSQTFVNMKDSIETVELFNFFKKKLK